MPSLRAMDLRIKALIILAKQSSFKRILEDCFGTSKQLIFLVLCLAMTLPALFLFSSANAEVLNLGINKAEVYKPSRLIVGSKTDFIVKAGPGSNVSITLALDEQGSEIIAKVDGTIGEKGITKLQLELPDKKELINKTAYFQVVVGDEIARIVGSDGVSTTSNAIKIMKKPSSSSLPGFGPSVPGVGDVSKAIEAVQDSSDHGLDDYYYNKPLILRNLR